MKAGQPFYLQVSHYAMHEGRECLPATREKYTQHPAVQAYYEKIGTTAEKVKRTSDPAIWLGMGEVHNIASTHADEHKQLYDAMTRYFKQVGARIPKPNPNYDAERYKNDKEYDERTAWGAFEGSRPLEEDEQ